MRVLNCLSWNELVIQKKVTSKNIFDIIKCLIKINKLCELMSNLQVEWVTEVSCETILESWRLIQIFPTLKLKSNEPQISQE